MNTVDKLKQQATILQGEAIKQGFPINRCEALEQVAKNNGFDSWRAAKAALEQQHNNPRPEAHIPPTTPQAAKPDAELKDYFVKRDGSPPLRFTGMLIGEGVADVPRNGVYFFHQIYRTKAGKYVTRYVDLSSNERREINQASLNQSAEEAVRWFRCKHTGEIAQTAQLALARAAKKDAAIDQAYCESVD